MNNSIDKIIANNSAAANHKIIRYRGLENREYTDIYSTEEEARKVKESTIQAPGESTLDFLSKFEFGKPKKANTTNDCRAKDKDHGSAFWLKSQAMHSKYNNNIKKEENII